MSPWPATSLHRTGRPRGRLHSQSRWQCGLVAGPRAERAGGGDGGERAVAGGGTRRRGPFHRSSGIGSVGVVGGEGGAPPTHPRYGISTYPRAPLPAAISRRAASAASAATTSRPVTATALWSKARGKGHVVGYTPAMRRQRLWRRERGGKGAEGVEGRGGREGKNAHTKKSSGEPMWTQDADNYGQCHGTHTRARGHCAAMAIRPHGEGNETAPLPCGVPPQMVAHGHQTQPPGSAANGRAPSPYGRGESLSRPPSPPKRNNTT